MMSRMMSAGSGVLCRCRAWRRRRIACRCLDSNTPAQDQNHQDYANQQLFHVSPPNQLGKVSEQ